MGQENAVLGDLTDYTTLLLTGSLVAASTISSTQASLAQVGLAIESSDIYTYDSTAEVRIAIKNITNKDVLVKVTSPALNGIKFSYPVTSIGLAAGQSYDFTFGKISKSIAFGLTDLPLTLKVVAAKTIVPTKKLKLPAGIKVVSKPMSDWWYVSDRANLWTNTNKTLVCLKVKNTTKKTITLKSALNWSFTGARILNRGFSVTTVKPNEAACVSGNYTDALYVAGDVRLAKASTITGTITAVKKYALVTTGLKMPANWKIDQRTSLSYNPLSKKTTLTLWFKSSTQDTGSDIVIRNLKINGKATHFDPGTGPIQASDSAGLRSLEIGSVAGDKRFGSKWTLTGTMSESASTGNFGGEWTQVSEKINCVSNYPWSWNYSPVTKLTRITVYCRNLTSKPVTLDISKTKISFGLDPDNMTTYQVPAAKRYIAMPAKQVYRLYTFFWIPGDVRTGGYSYAFSGSISLK